MRKVVAVALAAAAVVGMTAAPAQAQEEEGPPHSGVVLCIGQVLNLPFIDIPEDTILIGFGVSDEFDCPSQGRFT